MAGSDGVARLDNPPFLARIAHGALDERLSAPFEAALSPRSAERFETPPARRRGGPGRDERSPCADGAVAIGAVDFDGGSRFAIDPSVTVIVLCEVAIVALHAFFEVNVGQVDRFAPAAGVVEIDLRAVFVEPVAFTVVRVNPAIDPAVAVKVGELRGPELFVEFRAAGPLEKFLIAPQ